MNLKQRGVNWKETHVHVLFGTFNGAPAGYVKKKDESARSFDLILQHQLG